MFEGEKQYIRRKRNAACIIVVSETKDSLDPVVVDVANPTKTAKKCTEDDWECETGYDNKSDGSSKSICST